MKENYYLTIGLPLLGSGIMGSFIWLILSIGKEGVERRDACFEQCVPFAHRLVEQRVAPDFVPRRPDCPHQLRVGLGRVPGVEERRFYPVFVQDLQDRTGCLLHTLVMRGPAPDVAFHVERNHRVQLFFGNQWLVSSLFGQAFTLFRDTLVPKLPPFGQICNLARTSFGPASL